MGLSGRKIKQKIPDDPRNLSWADNAARFGSSYLAKFGWDASKGLGATGDGMTSHIKVSHKLDMLGIGAAHQKDPNGIAWKQNKDFENLLKRLNESKPQEEGDVVMQRDAGEEANPEATDKQDGEDGKKKKRKRSKDGEDRPEKDAKDATKKRKTSKEGSEEASTTDAAPVEVVETVVTVSTKPKAPLVPRHRSHRARAIAAKNIASKSASAISEILGIAPSSSSSGLNSGAETPQGKLTPLDDDVQIEKLTTSTKSVADYFKEKLLAKSGSKSYTPTTSISEVVASVEETESYELPRGGLGASRFRVEQTFDMESQRIGLSKFSSLMSSSFLTAMSTETAAEEDQSKEVNNLEKTKKPSEDGDLDKEERRRRRREKKEVKEKKRREKGSKAQAEISAEGAGEKGEDEEGQRKERALDSTDEERRKRKEEKKARKERKKRASADE